MTREVNDTGHTPSKGSRIAPFLKAERATKPNRATLALQRRPHNSDAAKRAQEFVRRAREAPMI
ncbi:hypothetical protein [Celeribacter sp.]|uniref:hypothetical protein n=1 Tax=Celeribacter sp. TaxID=1890673 RepID=UPI003A94CF60